MTQPAVVRGERPARAQRKQRGSLLVVRADATDVRASSLLAIHALAQGPWELRASLPPSDALARALLLARAYGVEARVHVRRVDAAAHPPDAVDVDASRATPAALLDRLLDVAPATPDGERVGREPLAGLRVAVVTNVPIHHKVDLFDTIAARLAKVGATLHVLFTSGVPPDRGWMSAADIRFEHTFLESFDLGRPRGRRMLPRGLVPALGRVAPDLVVSAGFSPLVSGRVSHWCARHGVPFGIWSGEIPSRPTARSRVRRRQRRALVRSADFGVAYGWQSARYLDALDPRLPVVIGRNTSVAPPRRDRADEGLLEILAVSRAAKGKALDLVVRAVTRLDDLPLRLTVVGDGPRLPFLRELADGSRRVRFAGAMPHDVVLECYARAHAFVFPSQYDLFGLVLVEAMAAGLPVITSAAPGAVTDLAVDGSNCIVVGDPTVDAWEAALRRLAEDRELRQRLGVRARLTVRRRWTIDHAAEAMLAGFRLGVLAQGSRAPAR